MTEPSLRCDVDHGRARVDPKPRGTINFFKTHIGAREESVTETVLQRFRAVLGHLVRRGWWVQRDPGVAARLAGSHYVGRKGQLEFAAHTMGRMFEFEFFQNVNVENRHGGRYDFDKFTRMPRPMQLACAVEMSHVLKKLLALGYVLEGTRQGIVSADLLAVLRHAQERTDEGDPLAAFNRRWNFESDWQCGGRFERDASGWPSAKETGAWGSKDRDGCAIVSGETLYCRRHGRLFRGVVRPNMNNMWILISHGRCVYVPAWELFRCKDPSAEPRRFVPGQAERVRAELEKALQAKKYRRVETLARVAEQLAEEEGALARRAPEDSAEREMLRGVASGLSRAGLRALALAKSEETS
jgi:hypothetical protein